MFVHRSDYHDWDILSILDYLETRSQTLEINYFQTSLTMCLFFHYRSEWDARYKRAARQRDEWQGTWKKRENPIKVYLNDKKFDFLLFCNVANDLIPEKDSFAKFTSNGHVMDIQTGHGRYPHARTKPFNFLFKSDFYWKLSKKLKITKKNHVML